MKVICPKCQFENQADSSRVVCARCATIIEIKPDQGAGLEANGKRQTARLPFVGNVGNSQPLPPPPIAPNRDVYATRIGDDFDDVLDIPRQTQPTAPHSNEPTTKFEDVFAMPNYEATTTPYDLQQQEKKPTGPIEGFPTGTSKQRSTQDYEEVPEPEFMGWPVLPESNDYEQDQAGGFSANRGALLLRVSMVVLVFGLLSVLAYYLLYDKISSRQHGLNDRISSNTPNSAQLPPASVPSPEAGLPAAKPSVTNPVSEAPKSTEPIQTNQSSGQKIDIVPVNGKSGHASSPKPAPAIETPVPASKQGSLTIQVASFNDQGQANERVNSLRSKGEDARSVKVDIPGKGTWYRVQIGGFKSREDAISHASQLKSKGILQDYIVTTIGK
ncbi:MAG: SPOR domain-containing protein [Acidobacteria bacterium]|nr:SPOR domain-containing protein [Acidobacteriota bacterium]